MKNQILALFGIGIIFSACSQNGADESTTYKNEVATSQYWKDGMAEVNVYELQQNRYNNIHNGTLMSIFVPEDFLYEKQVKNDNYTDEKSTPIIKNIQTRKFTTGIYDYSMFTSTFTPLDQKKFPRSLKVTSSSQEWCGTTFLQVNRKKDGYKMELRSYFESEGDEVEIVKGGILEDELFNLIRINPASLPIGNFKLIPSLMYTQLRHVEMKSFNAESALEEYKGDVFKGEKLMSYSFEIPDLKRTVKIVFENNAPYKIVGWEDTYPSAFDKKNRTTLVKLKTTSKIDYWNKNNPSDEKQRLEIGVE